MMRRGAMRSLTAPPPSMSTARGTAAHISTVPTARFDPVSCSTGAAACCRSKPRLRLSDLVFELCDLFLEGSDARFQLEQFRKNDNPVQLLVDAYHALLE